MEIINKDKVLLETISEATETQSPKCEITINETKIKATINGVDLELCVRHGNYFLVITSDDCAFEESLNVYLLERDGQIIDSATIFWPYGTGSFKFLKFTEPNSLNFSFFDGKIWEIEIFNNKCFYLPYFSEPSGVWRKTKFSRNFKISEITSLESQKKSNEQG